MLDKHTSLFVWTVNDEEKKFYNIECSQATQFQLGLVQAVCFLCWQLEQENQIAK